ncbi:MAG: trigger factor [Betaproteobacteria bacterium]|nr:trigger factor [Betaproteobacteria bacterium]
MGKTMKMPGFRPGKVPLKVVQQAYGAQAQSEAIGDAVSNAYAEAVVAQNLRPAGPPEVRPVEGSALDPSATTLAFEAVVEVYPEVPVPDRSGLEVQRWVCEVMPSDIDQTLETLRKQRVTYEPVARAAQAEDQLRVDFAGTIDGVAFEGGSAKDFRFIVQAGQMLPEFDAAVVGMQAGESKTFPLNFPADYRAQDLAGKSGEFTVTVHEVMEPRLPELDDSLAAAFGIQEGGVERLRADVKKNLEREVAGRCKAKTKQAVMDALLAQAFFDVPKALVQSESQRLADQMRQDMASRGMNVKDAPIPPELFAEQAAKRVRLGLLVGEIVRSQGLQASESQVHDLLSEMAESYEKPQEFIHWTMSNPERRAEAESVVIEDNVVTWTMDQARVESRTISVEELMKEAA